MPRTATTLPKENRLSIRANSGQKSVLARAAKAQHMNVSQIVLQASLAAAQKVIEEENRILISAEEYDWLMQKLEEPPQNNAALRHLLSEAPPWSD